MNLPTKEKTMTIKELSNILNVTERTIQIKAKELFPGKIKNGIQTRLNEKEITSIKLDLEKKFEVKTDIEKNMIVMQAMQILQENNEELVRRAEKAESELLQAQPAIAFTEQVLSSKDSIKIGDFAKIISDENIDIGQNKLFKWLRDGYYLMKDNMPYQKSINQGLFEVIERPIDTPYGIKLTKTTLITPKGQVYFTEKLRDLF